MAKLSDAPAGECVSWSSAVGGAFFLARWNSMVDEAARQRALQALRRKRSLKHQLRLYVIVNAILVLVWLGSGRGSFWPIYPIAFWGISLLIQGWSASHPDREFSEEEIAREMERS
jgi:hypothetical protein